MRTIVAIAILCLVIILLAVMLYILARRSWSGIKGALQERKRSKLAAEVSRWLASDAEPAPRVGSWSPAWLGRDLLVDLCMERVRTAPGRERERLVAWLQEAGHVSRWIEQLRSRSEWKRANAAERLGVLKTPSGVEPLVAALADPVFDVRMRAAKALGALGGERARRALVDALTEENRWSVIRITDLLAQMGPDVVGELLAAFPDMARASRLATLDLVAHIGDAAATPFLVELVDELDRDVRARACSALGRIGDERAIPRLVAALHDSEWPVRAMAAKALGERGAEVALDELKPALRDREWWVRSNAAEAMRKLGPRGLDALVSMVDDQDRFARDQALSMLETSGELARRLAGLDSAIPAERAESERLLRLLVSRNSRSRLESIRDRQAGEAVRKAMDRAVATALPGRGAS